MKKIRVGIAMNSGAYGAAWIDYCTSRGIEYAQFDMYDSNLFKKIDGCTHFLARPSVRDPISPIFARPILYGIEQKGIHVFPDHATFWHYDNKLAQKYLLEAIGAPVVPSQVFYEKAAALAFVEHAHYPLVFKLKAGAGSANVALLKTERSAIRRVLRMFGRGMSAIPSYWTDFSNRARQVKGTTDAVGKAVRMPRTILQKMKRRMSQSPDRGYFYVQEYVPNNMFDTRITIIGDRAFGFRRFVRPNDFRASGSGRISWDSKEIDLQCVHLAHEVSRKLRCQSMAYDFVHDPKGSPKIVEISYTYMAEAVRACSGYWTRNGEFIEGEYCPAYCIIKDLIEGR